MSLFGSISIHHPTKAEADGTDGHNWLRMSRNAESLSIHTTAARAAAMAFAFNHPERVLALAEADPVAIVTSAEVA